jgi:hypothetical protein
MTQPNNEIVAAARKVADALDADVLLYTGSIAPRYDDLLIGLTRNGKKRTNILLVLTTFGGSPDSAYRIARALQHQYRNGKFLLLVDTFCKSAGALIAVGSDELIMSDAAELGPLDVQVLDKEEIGEYSSGLTSMQALTMLQEESARLFMHHFNKLHDPSVGFSTKLAADIAAKHVTGLFSAIYSQLDPYRLGENQRAMHIGITYGKRLSIDNNVSEETLMKLVAGYPSHSFVIDRTEASFMFPAVREPSVEECKLLAALEAAGKFKGTKIEWIFCEESQPKADDNAQGDGHGHGNPGPIPQGAEPNNGPASGSVGGGVASKAASPTPANGDTQTTEAPASLSASRN